jgi:cation diffusion facilitator family transporter
MASGGPTGVVLVALSCNFAIAAAKFATAVWTGSSAMLSEAIHSLVTTSSQAFMLVGLKRAARPADARQPFGYSREIYFWSFAVAILLFAMGAGVTIYEGVAKLAHPHPVTDPHVSYAVLATAAFLLLISTIKTASAFKARGSEKGLQAPLRSTKEAALFSVLLESLAGLAGLLVAFAGIVAADQFGIAEADGIASIVIGLIMGTVAAFMSIEIHALLIAEPAAPAVTGGIQPPPAAQASDNRAPPSGEATLASPRGPVAIQTAAKTGVGASEPPRAQGTHTPVKAPAGQIPTPSVRKKGKGKRKRH